MDEPFKVPEAQKEQGNPYLPGHTDLLLFEQFMGINTSTTRPGVDDKQAWWLDGFMPIGPRFLRTLPDVGPHIHFEDNVFISFFGFGNIAATPYCIVIHTDGSVHAVNTVTLSEQQVAPSGTISAPSVNTCGISQWGSDFIIIVSNQPNGYFLWDGTNFYQAGTLGPQVVITNGGSGYTSAPSVTISGGSGSGAALTATVANGIVTEIKVTNPGSGWLAGEAVTVNFSGGGGTSAAATADIMPYAISGTCVEIYTGRVWVANAAVVTFSAPGSVIDFSSANGGGNFTSTDSYLKNRFTKLVQTNGFLYLVADSSINYISGVTTSGVPPVTTFTNQNADPQVGTPWPATVSVFGRNIVLANAFGAHVSYGAAVTKISTPLDGVYNTVPNFAGFSPSSAQAILFGKKVWMFLLPVIDPISNQQVNKIFMTNDFKTWWSSQQSKSLIYIQYQEIDSVLTAFGTDGTGIYPLFSTPSSLFTKTAQSKLWDRPGYMFAHMATRLWGLAQYYSLDSPNLIVSIDNETGQQSNTLTLGPPDMVWRTVTGALMAWTTVSGAAMNWTAAGIVSIQPTAVGQNGVLLGMTAETNCSDMAIISLALDNQIGTYRG